MSDFDIRISQKPDIKNPIMVEGLPGIGHVGRIAARHLVKELKARKFGAMYSDSFPPQVLIKKSGIIVPMKNEFYFWKAEEKDQRDIIFVVGNTQSSTPDGQYALTKNILNLAKEYGVDMIYTLGGLGVGRIVEKPKVFGAVTHKELIPELEKLNVIVKRDSIGQIIGISGLLLGMGRLANLKGICIMGETSGYYLDPNSSKAVLNVLMELINVTVDMESLTKSARDTKRRVAEAQKIEKKMMEEMGMIQKEPTDDVMRYIG